MKKSIDNVDTGRTFALTWYLDPYLFINTVVEPVAIILIKTEADFKMYIEVTLTANVYLVKN